MRRWRIATLLLGVLIWAPLATLAAYVFPVVGDIAVERSARLDADRIHKYQLGKSLRTHQGDLGGRPTTH